MRLQLRGVLLALALAGSAVLGTATVVTADLAVRNGAYFGVSPDFGRIDFTMEGTSEIRRFLSTHSTDTGPGCENTTSAFDSSLAYTVPVYRFQFAGEFNNRYEDVAFTGTFGNEGRVDGTYESGSPTPGRCLPRKFSWQAILLPEGVLVPAATAFAGTTADGGTVTFTTSVTGDAIHDAQITPSRHCAALTGGAHLDERGVTAWSDLDATNGRTTLVRIAVSGSRAAGAYVVDRRDPNCPPAIGTFTAIAVVTATPPPAAASDTPAPTATPDPASSGKFTSGIVPLSGFALVVFGGGNAQRIATAAACTAPTLTAFASVDGSWVPYIPATTITAVNAAFIERFPGGAIPAGTPLLVRCR